MCQMVVVVQPGLWPCLLFCFPMKPGLLHLYVCVCAQSGESGPLLVQNSLEVVAMRSRLICLNHQQTIVKSAFGKGISRRSALAAIVFYLSSAVSKSVTGLNVTQRSKLI